MSNIHPDGCDACGEIRELYHFDAEAEDNPYDGQALCDVCNGKAQEWDENSPGVESDHDSISGKWVEDEAEIGQFHGEINRVREDIAALLDEDGVDTTGVTRASLVALDAQAVALLALPEESVAALVAAAQSMVGAASFGR